MVRFAWIVVVLALGFVLMISLGRPAEPQGSEPTVVEEVRGAIVPQADFELPLGLRGQALVIPADNPMSPAKIALGEQLFFDARLSGTHAMSCETCHLPEQGWTDGLVRSPKYDGTLNGRHTPTLYGVGFAPELGWDGHAQGLEAQILEAWTAQMGADTHAVVTEIARIEGYRAAFLQAFGGPVTETRILQALASFVRTIQAGDTAWDRRLPKDEGSSPASEVGRGFDVFSNVAECTQCHLPPVFTDTRFHNVGIGMDAEPPDPGRAASLAASTERPGESSPPEAERLTGAFKTPSLRGVALHPPYFHDGSADTLEAAVDLMLAGGLPNPYLDDKLKPRALTPAQHQALLAFLTALSPEVTPYRRPTLPQ